MKTALTLFFFSSIWISSPNMEVYKALRGESAEVIETVLSDLQEKKTSPLNNAYIGTLLMKKSEYMTTARKKVSIFKEGHAILETEIANDPGNAEYRFLRFAIQEHAPKILGYNKNIENDKKQIIENFKTFSPTLQDFIKEYALKSPNLELILLQ